MDAASGALRVIRAMLPAEECSKPSPRGKQERGGRRAR